AEDRAVDVRLGGQVDDRLAALSRAGDGLGIGDVPDAKVAVDPVEVLPAARVGELVEHDDLVAAPDEALDEVAADETAAAGDEDPHAPDGSWPIVGVHASSGGGSGPPHDRGGRPGRLCPHGRPEGG